MVTAAGCVHVLDGEKLHQHPVTVQTEHAHSHPSPFSLPLSLSPTQTHNPFFSTTHNFCHTDSSRTVTSFICAITSMFCSPLLHFPRTISCILYLLFPRWTFFQPPLCISFCLQPSLRLVLWLCTSQISAMSGWRLYQQLPSLTPCLTFSPPLQITLSFF